MGLKHPKDWPTSFIMACSIGLYGEEYRERIFSVILLVTLSFFVWDILKTFGWLAKKGFNFLRKKL
jgi:hypothetical protein